MRMTAIIPTLESLIPARRTSVEATVIVCESARLQAGTKGQSSKTRASIRRFLMLAYLICRRNFGSCGDWI